MKSTKPEIQLGAVCVDLYSKDMAELKPDEVESYQRWWAHDEYDILTSEQLEQEKLKWTNLTNPSQA